MSLAVLPRTSTIGVTARVSRPPLAVPRSEPVTLRGTPERPRIDFGDAPVVIPPTTSEPLLTESGEDYLTETGEALMTEGSPAVSGSMLTETGDNLITEAGDQLTTDVG